ncbi:radical SAM protein [archaeon]|nr:MAG: radical SAM protein [archaeon]HDM23680.1 radical SAM protein [Candidatus Bathyarchaeota archaeon]
MNKLPRFKSSKALYCTCPPKYSLNTYLGRCQHGCVYCYAVKFPSFIGPTLPRLDMLEKLERAVKKTFPILPVMLCDSTDPYQPIEKKFKVTRRVIETLAKHDFPMLVLTKSDLVTRDVDIYSSSIAVVGLTVTTIDDEVASRIEPNAPSPDYRIDALSKLSGAGVPTYARIDPIIPTVNDDEKMLEKLVKELIDAGVEHITVSTLKLVGDLDKLKILQPDEEKFQKIYRLYASSKPLYGYRYLPFMLRQHIVRKVRKIVLKYGASFASCRENLAYLNTGTCDGSHLFKKFGREIML